MLICGGGIHLDDVEAYLFFYSLLLAYLTDECVRIILIAVIMQLVICVCL